MEVTLPTDKLGLVLKVGLFLFLALAGLIVFPIIFRPAGYLIQAALGTFAAAAIANAIALRVFERGRLADIGMNWHPGSARNLGVGIAGGIGAACLVLVGPLATGLADMQPSPDQPGSAASVLFVTVVLLFGAVGEEMLFRGYGFQVLMGGLGRFATILPVSVLFSLAHLNNPNATLMSTVNTFGFSVVLGYAFIRSGDLWLPIGVHFGWNWVLPLFGVNLSGFTMGVTGFAMHWKVGAIWSGGNYGPEASALTSLVIILLGIYLRKAPVERQKAFLLDSLPEA